MKNKSVLANKENRMSLERRLSLKYSSASNPRMSAPIRRDSLGALSSITTKNQTKESRQSLISIKSQVLNRPVKKQAIISNLLSKLEHEDDLKTIIESKIRSKHFSNEGSGNRNETMLYGEDTNYLTEKLQSCEEELDSFKDIVRHLTEKIAVLEQNESMKTPLKIDFHKEKKKRVRDFGVQTSEPQEEEYTLKTENNALADIDFLNNLDRTLKVLSNKKK